MKFPLNSEQMQAVGVRWGYTVVPSGPGSGKTRTIVERVKALLEEGYPAEIILATTFTKEASLEMSRRANLEGDQKIFRTFHSLCLQIVTQERSYLPFTLLHAPPEAGQQRKLLGSICRTHRLDFKKLTGYISAMKRNGLSPEQAMEKALGAEGMRLAMGYGDYEKQCREQGWLDFDSMLIESVKLLEKHEDVRKRWQYRFVIVDEAQDTDDIQWRLIELLSEENKNVFVVGDEEQLIYAWRGAKPDGLSNFAKRFPGAETIYLFRNYRSTEEIVAFCKQLAPKKSELIDRMVSERGSGLAPRVIKYASDSDEASKIIGSITRPEESAILTRTNRQLARFENACIDRGIKYNLLGKSGFWVQPEVKYLLAYTQAVNYATDAAVKTIIQSPYRETKYLKKRDLIAALDSKAKRDKAATGTSKPYLAAMTDPEILNQFADQPHQQDNIKRTALFIRSFQSGKTLPAYAALQNILDRADVKSYYETEEEGDGDNDALENINELFKVSSRFTDVPSFLDHARRAIAASRKSKQPRLTLSTVHQAKGKEWNYVFVAGVNKDVLPHKRGEINEEKRIMYVACTRAAQELCVSFYGVPSEFLAGFWNPDTQKDQDNQPLPGFNGQPGLFEGLI
jgi:DNA helicase II / ATP-dependent DNA helicase PcrA